MTTLAPKSLRIDSNRLQLAINILLPLLALAAIAFYALYTDHQNAALQTGSMEVPVSPAIENRYGIRLVHVAVLADGGLVDLRYLVLDEEKASALWSTPATTPVLISNRGKKINEENMKHRHNVIAGVQHSMVLGNPGGALVSGDRVTLKIGDLQLTNIPVY